ncbi:hypothetical protein OIDMADRAFT_17912 [Oidiodendron maius Zn]|uniref:Uncharacterized protein n=1 Tax=Oidiodendron maius (strain Zn) TaxID=913774 RepID=A0A0C3HJW0_OIDMZ|nr:hypothetical protein OIDMADRAFT_17912 [Oidiodendron maius Zn]
MPLVTGKEEKVKRPGKLPSRALKFAEEAIKESQQKEDNPKPKPDCERPTVPRRFKEPAFWSSSNVGWMCKELSDQESRKFMIWDKDKGEWQDFETREMTFSTKVPEGFHQPKPSKTWFEMFKTFFVGGNK